MVLGLKARHSGVQVYGMMGASPSKHNDHLHLHVLSPGVPLPSLWSLPLMGTLDGSH